MAEEFMTDAMVAAQLRAIDFDRGVMICSHPSGVDVYMYFDDPGVYLTAHATKVSEEMARAAGYDVEVWGKKRQIRVAMAQAQAKVMEQFAAAELEANIVVKEKGGFKVVDIGVGRFVIKDPDDETITDQAMSKEAAEILLDQLVPDEAL